jgi:hypothetical protein
MKNKLYEIKIETNINIRSYHAMAENVGDAVLDAMAYCNENSVIIREVLSVARVLNDETFIPADRRINK